MQIADHIDKWRRFDAARAQLDPVGDFELWFWALLSGGTALVNAALHAAGITQQNEQFATQIPNVYAVHDAPDKWHHVLAIDCDLIHVGVPPLATALPPDIAEAFAAMDIMEGFRDTCVRSDRPFTAEVIAACQRSYEQVLCAVRGRLPEVSS